MDLRYIYGLLGHKSLETIETYTLSIKKIVSPLDNLKTGVGNK